MNSQLHAPSVPPPECKLITHIGPQILPGLVAKLFIRETPIEVLLYVQISTDISASIIKRPVAVL